MEKSLSIKAIATALGLFHMKVSKVKKDATNPFFKSKYASLSNILEAIDVPLEESGLTFSQFPTGEHGLVTILMHGESGEYLQDTYTMRPVKDDPQGIGSCITYQKRYALAAVLGLNIDEDDDGNAASTQPKKATEKTVTGTVEEIKWINPGTDSWKKAVQFLIDGGDIKKIAARLSKENKARLENEVVEFINNQK